MKNHSQELKQIATNALAQIKGTIHVLDSIYPNIENETLKEIVTGQSTLLKIELSKAEQKLKQIEE